MPIYICKHCSARSTVGGNCIICGRNHGSITKAIAAAAISSVLLGLLWMGLAVVLKTRITWVACLYGGLVSGAVAHFSGGRGFIYQAVATGCTIAGLLLADTVVVRWYWHELAPNWDPNVPPPTVWALLPFRLQHDPLALVFLGFGVFGGLWLWHQPSE